MRLWIAESPQSHFMVLPSAWLLTLTGHVHGYPAVFTLSSLGSSTSMQGLKCPFAMKIFIQLFCISCRAQKACLRLLPLK